MGLSFLRGSNRSYGAGRGTKMQAVNPTSPSVVKCFSQSFVMDL
jgi:hypothetical protein